MFLKFMRILQVKCRSAFSVCSVVLLLGRYGQRWVLAGLA